MPYTTQDIRNIALVGQAGAGKTLLAEALLAQSGAIRSKGSLARGTTVCDFDPQEKALLHSLDAAICGFETQGRRVNMIDTPGYPDFLGRTLSALEAVETAVIVVSAVNGVEPMTQRMMDFARTRGLCRLIVVNKIDTREARTEQVMAELRETFGKSCLPLNLPAEGGASVVDCFFQSQGKATDFSSVAAAHTEIIDQVVEVDEKLMALYLEQGEELLNPEQLHDPFEQALREDHLIPVCFCSAETGAGIPELLAVLARLAPNPAEGNPPPFLKGEGDAAERVTDDPRSGEARPRARVQGHDRSVRRQDGHFPGAPGHGAARRAVAGGRRPQADQAGAPVPAARQGPRGDHPGRPGRHLRGAQDRRNPFRRRAARLARRGQPSPEVGDVSARDARPGDPLREARRRAEAVRRPAPPDVGGSVRARRASRRAERDGALRPR